MKGIRKRGRQKNRWEDNIKEWSGMAALLFWFFMVVLLSICLWYVMIVATCIAVHVAFCHALYNKNKKMGKNRCLVFLNDLVLFCSVILSFLIVMSNEPRQN